MVYLSCIKTPYSLHTETVKKMKLLIDADGCPVIDEAEAAAGRAHMKCILFCDSAHVFASHPSEVVTTAQGADSADFALVNRVVPGDVVVTQDRGLAAMALAKGARVVDQNGLEITDRNIGFLLETRSVSKKLRRSGRHLKGPKKRTRQNDLDFIKTLERMLHENTDRA